LSPPHPSSIASVKPANSGSPGKLVVKVEREIVISSKSVICIVPTTLRTESTEPVSTGVSDWLESLVSKMSCDALMGTFNYQFSEAMSSLLSA